MRFQEFEERIKAITTSVVATERTRSGGDEWLMNKCSKVCGDLMKRLRTELGDVGNWEFVPTTGFWTGYIPDGCSKDHEWMCIRFNEQELILTLRTFSTPELNGRGTGANKQLWISVTQFYATTSGVPRRTKSELVSTLFTRKGEGPR
jgi:hypothetical protein